MKPVVLFFLVALLSCKGSQNTPDPNRAIVALDLVGRWEYAERYTKATDHYYFDFNSNDSLTWNYTTTTNNVVKTGTDGTFGYSIEGNLLRLKRPPGFKDAYGDFTTPKNKECYTFVLPPHPATTLTTKNLGLNYCVYAPTGSETGTVVTLVKQ